MRFELGKFYRHVNGGAPFHVVAIVENSTAYFNPSLLAEDTEGMWRALGADEVAAQNHVEISAEEYYGVWYKANPHSDELRRLAGKDKE